MELYAAAMSSLIPKLSSLLGEEYKLHKRLRGDIRFLQEELQRIRDFILRLSGAEVEHEVAVLLWDARELSYDIEDSVDWLMVRVQAGDPGFKPQGFKRFFHRTVNLLTRAKIRHKMATDMKGLKSLAAEVSIRRGRYRSGSSITRQLLVGPRPLASLADAPILVGMECPLDELSKLLLMEEEQQEDPESVAQLKVISIVGSGGLGKTTLANEVYRRTKAYFDFTAWVSVSQSPDIKKILINILRQVKVPRSRAGDGERDEGGLIAEIRELLHDKRYLLVLDDLWTSHAWETIRYALPSNSCGSRIITTTRISSVAESCCPHWNDRIYNIRPLSVEDSRMLFYRIIFGSDGRCPPDLVDVSDRILKKCSGLPLAIICVSHLLVTQTCEKQTWEDVYNSIAANHGSIESIKNVLLLSYNDLPAHLKTCLLYLSIFPYDSVINHDCIVRRWIAEGLCISRDDGRTPEEVGESYLNELISRNMIQPFYGSSYGKPEANELISINMRQPRCGSYFGKPEAYQIHYLMLDLIRSISFQENFVTILDNSGLYASSEKVRRLSVINIKDHSIREAVDTYHIRSLSIFGDVDLKLSFKHFTILRVLDLEGCKALKNSNVEEIAELFHLRYLSVRDTPISELPDQIGQLRFLTTLDLRDTSVQELPSSVVKLRSLAYLLCDKLRFPEWIGKMTALSCLSQFDILQSEIIVLKELGNLSELRELVLWWFSDMESNNAERYEHLAVSLYRLGKLHSLSIHGGDSSVDLFNHLHHPLRQLHRIQLHSSCYLIRIPEWFRSLAMLTYACIDVKEVKNEDLKLLSELPSLLHLSLSSKAMPTEKLVISGNGFLVLREFHLHSVRADLTSEPQAMPKLEDLLLSIHVLPEEAYGFSISIDQFTCLKKIDIRIYGEGAAASQLLEATDVAIRGAAEKHPNQPIVSIIPLGKVKEQEMEPIKG